MPTVKVLDKKASKIRREELCELLWKLGVQPQRIHEGTKTHFVILSQGELESKERPKTKEFEVTTPLEYNASKTIVVKRLDAIIDAYSDEEVIAGIEQQNEWMEVEDLYRFQTTTKILKIRCKTSTMETRPCKRAW